jgi:serine/threonine-protein kinase
VPGYERGPTFDSILECALAKDRRDRFPTAGAFRDAILAAVGRPVPRRVSSASLFEASDLPTEVLPSSGALPSNALPPAHWDPAVLIQVEQMLARHIGPMASVLVRRSARLAQDLPTLYTRLAEQVTSPEARSAFLAETSAVRTGSRPSGTRPPSTGGGATRTPPSGVPTHPPASATAPHAAAVPVTEALVGQATKLLARHVGPIATVLARRAASAGGGGALATREQFFAALEKTVADPEARRELRAELDKLH